LKVGVAEFFHAEFFQRESQKENWKNNYPELTQHLHRLAWISKRELKDSKLDEYGDKTRDLMESQKENWKAILISEKSSRASISESQKENWKRINWDVKVMENEKQESQKENWKRRKISLRRKR